ncbi:signal peptidase I [Candidatus Synechococcus calcipolaris G9]|uniref:Signal peptidase I n=1 Tax=Candidatus Synechococcus calcipolaris G9 TaxID=1497997 RepID=A0ABT6F1L8_9SYNE|nr:signal peptidase I [Candidatus Synechococcus calcipolaris]MDG2991755.1 signal peptidase I [Candidatus Synechococcus calcipolaris G9]
MSDGGLKPSESPESTPLSSPPAEHQDVWWLEILKTLGLAAILAFGIRTFIAEARYIPSGSMERTLEINDRLIIEKIGYRFNPPQRGDIIVFNPTPALMEVGFRDAFIKRVVGLPGDRVAIREGRVFINDQPLDEPYLDPATFTGIDSCAGTQPYLDRPQTIPEDSYLVLGDNRSNSYDGRCWGIVPRNYIIGRAAIRFWPNDRWGLITNELPHELRESHSPEGN